MAYKSCTHRNPINYAVIAITITPASHERHSVSNHGQLHCFFNSWLSLSTMKHQRSALMALGDAVDSPHKVPLMRKTSPRHDVAMTKRERKNLSGFPSQSATNAENVSMSWRQHLSLYIDIHIHIFIYKYNLSISFYLYLSLFLYISLYLSFSLSLSRFLALSCSNHSSSDPTGMNVHTLKYTTWYWYYQRNVLSPMLLHVTRCHLHYRS